MSSSSVGGMSSSRATTSGTGVGGGGSVGSGGSGGQGAGPVDALFFQDNDGLAVADPVAAAELGPAYGSPGLTDSRLDGKFAIVADPLGDPDRGNVLKITVLANTFGAASIGPADFDDETELYAAWDMYLDPNVELPGGAKVAGFLSYGSPNPGPADVTGGGDCRTGWSYRLMYWTPRIYSSVNSGIPGDNCIGPYTYRWSRNGFPLGDSRKGLPNGGTFPTRVDNISAGMGNDQPVGFIRGRWNTIQMRLMLNTAGDGGASGITELWVNGYKTYSANGLLEFVPDASEQNYQLAGNESAGDYKINRFKIRLYHGGGSSWQSSQTVEYYFDNLTVSRSPIVAEVAMPTTQ